MPSFAFNEDGGDNGCDLFRFLHERFELLFRHDGRFTQKAKPVKAFSCFFLGDSELVDKVRTTLACLGLLNVCTYRTRGPQVLIPEDPASTSLSFL